MAIVTLDGIITGSRPPILFGKSSMPSLLVNRAASLWGKDGITGVGAFDSTLNGVALSQTGGVIAGAIPHYDPASGNAYLARLRASISGNTGTLFLLDRLWHNGGFDEQSTADQFLSSVAWPARCPTSGLDETPSNAGHGVLVALEVSVAAVNANASVTLGYTNSAGVSGRFAFNSSSLGNTNQPVGTVNFFGLQENDAGIQSIQSLTLNVVWGSLAAINLVAYRLIAAIEITSQSIPSALDAITGGRTRLYNGTVPWLVFVPAISGTTSANTVGSIVEAHG